MTATPAYCLAVLQWTVRDRRVDTVQGKRPHLKIVQVLHRHAEMLRHPSGMGRDRPNAVDAEGEV